MQMHGDVVVTTEVMCDGTADAASCSSLPSPAAACVCAPAPLDLFVFLLKWMKIYSSFVCLGCVCMFFIASACSCGTNLNFICQRQEESSRGQDQDLTVLSDHQGVLGFMLTLQSRDRRCSSTTGLELMCAGMRV